MTDPRHIAMVLDAMPSVRERVGPSTYARAFTLIEAAGFLSAAELALALTCSESHAEACLAAYYRTHPDAWAAELARRRRILEPFR